MPWYAFWLLLFFCFLAYLCDQRTWEDEIQDLKKRGLERGACHTDVIQQQAWIFSLRCHSLTAAIVTLDLQHPCFSLDIPFVKPLSVFNSTHWLKPGHTNKASHVLPWCKLCKHIHRIQIADLCGTFLILVVSNSLTYVFHLYASW